MNHVLDNMLLFCEQRELFAEGHGVITDHERRWEETATVNAGGMTGKHTAALYAFAVYYVTCVAVTRWCYWRRSAEIPC